MVGGPQRCGCLDGQRGVGSGACGNRVFVSLVDAPIRETYFFIAEDVICCFGLVFIRVAGGQYGGAVLAAYAHVRGPKGRQEGGKRDGYSGLF